MGKRIELMTPLHKQTPRDYLARMNDDKIHCMRIAKQYGYDYWDGDRRYGYGGYKFIPGRWKPIAEKLIREYGLIDGMKILDVGCGKGYLLQAFKELLPSSILVGFDISEYGIKNAHEDIKDCVYVADAANPLIYKPFADMEFDLAISTGVYHNLLLPQLNKALVEIDRVSVDQFIMMESYRDNKELFNLECWALTAQSLLTPEEWGWMFANTGYTGDYEFIYFE
jgi:SAM-dependent methyltransferase